MRRVVVGAVVALLTAAGLALGWYLTRAPAGPLPSTDPAAVAAITVEDATNPQSPWPVVDPADYPRVLGLFEGGVPDPTLPDQPFVWRDHGPPVKVPIPTTWVHVGGFTIHYRNRKIRVVTLFRTGSERGAYSVTGLDSGTAYYRGSSDEEIAATLAACLQRFPKSTK